MKEIVYVFIGLLIWAPLMCKKSSDDETAPVDGGNDDATGDDDDGSDVDTDSLETHGGCVEEAGKDCLESDASGECVKNDACIWGVDQCLPSGLGCRNEKTQAGCEALDYCVFKTWENQAPCIFACSVYWDEESCEAAKEGCEWREIYCLPAKQRECQMQADKESCEKVEDCAYVDKCYIAGYCPKITDEKDCAAQSGCVWQDKQCIYECQVKFTTEEECEDSYYKRRQDTDSETDSETETENELACEWSSSQKICINELPWVDMMECGPLEGDECNDNKKCRVIQRCDINVDCYALNADECVKNDYCSAGVCDHICSPKKSPQGCNSIGGCMWINVNYKPGQSCVTACH